MGLMKEIIIELENNSKEVQRYEEKLSWRVDMKRSMLRESSKRSGLIRIFHSIRLKLKYGRWYKSPIESKIHKSCDLLKSYIRHLEWELDYYYSMYK